MSKITNIIEARMQEAANQSAASTEAAALTELHQIAVNMSRIADTVEDRLEKMEAQVRMLNAPRPRPKLVPFHQRPVLLLQIALVVLAVILLVSGTTYMHSHDRMVCQQTQRPGVMLCTKI